jgi:hypothetical protein
MNPAQIHAWWRRFYPVMKVPKKFLYKGAPELIQRIEFGEFDTDPLFVQAKLEEVLLQSKIDLINVERMGREAKEDKIYWETKTHKKRMRIMREKHHENEFKLLRSLRDALIKGFEMTDERVDQIMETCDGDARFLFYFCFYEKRGQILTEEEYDKIPRLIQAQPKHMLRKKQIKYQETWNKIADQLHEKLR